MKLVFDIETNGLKPDKIHCIVAIDVEHDKVYKFRPTEISEGIKFLQQADTLIGHNITGFDIPVIKRLTGQDLYKRKPRIRDTLIMSRLFNPMREGHSLKDWGFKLNCPKSESPEDFEEFTEDMLRYCIQDVRLNKILYFALQEESIGFSQDSIELEHETAKILAEQRDFGFLLDERQATLLLSSLTKRQKEVEKEVQETFEPKWVDVKEVFPKIKKDGTLSKQGLTAEEYEKIKKNYNVDHPEFNNFSFMRKKLQVFNLGSRKQIGEYLMDFGWKPKRFTPTGQPIVDEGTLKKITHIHEANLIAEFLLLQKRIAQVQSWLDALDKDSRVHGWVISTGTITGRMSHRNPNMAQVPSVTSPYGKECRACWTVDNGNRLVGVDASQLELRMLAHYMGDKEYINEIINGDIHSTNQRLAGLESRDQSKTFIYALIYSAGNERLGQVVGGNRAEGKRLREQFLSSNRPFATLKNRVDQAAKKGYLKGIDGRKILIRHQHAALNTLLQGCGAIAMKKALVILQDFIDLQDIPAKFVANIHDEWQLEVPEEHAETIGKLAVRCIEQASKELDMRCPLTGEYKIGRNWSETH